MRGCSPAAFCLRHSSERARATERKEVRWVPLHTCPRLTSGLASVQDQLALLKWFSGHLSSSAAARPTLLAPIFLPLSPQSHPHNQFLKGREHFLYVFSCIHMVWGWEGRIMGCQPSQKLKNILPHPLPHIHTTSCRTTNGSHSGRAFGKISVSH